MERTVWAAMKSEHALRRGRPDSESAETFFNSVTRRVFSTVGVDPAIEYLDQPPPDPDPTDVAIWETYRTERVDAALVRRMLLTLPWSVPYAQLDRDAVLVAELIDARVEVGRE